MSAAPITDAERGTQLGLRTEIGNPERAALETFHLDMLEADAADDVVLCSRHTARSLLALARRALGYPTRTAVRDREPALPPDALFGVPARSADRDGVPLFAAWQTAVREHIRLHRAAQALPTPSAFAAYLDAYDAERAAYRALRDHALRADGPARVGDTP